MGCSAEAAVIAQQGWATSTFRKYRRTLTLLCRYLAQKGKPKELLMDPRQASGCAMSFLQDAEARGEKGSSLKVMAGHMVRVVQLIHPINPSSVLHLFAKGLRRRYPTANRVRDTIWDIDVLLDYIREACPDNEKLSDEGIMNKTMLLIMVFAASRPVELARMEMPAARDIGKIEAHLRATPKQRSNERTSVIIHQVSITSLCPLAALKEWLRRPRDVSPLLFRHMLGRPTAADLSKAGIRAPGDASPVGSRDAPLGTSGNTSQRHFIPPDFVWHPSGYRDLTPGDISEAFKAIMLAAGIPERYNPYTIRHSTVTALFLRGASDEQVAAYGRWAPGSKVPRLFYFIHATDGTWIGKKLIEEQPTLRAEFLLLGKQGEDKAEAEDGSRAADSSPASEAE
jgi:hypothetical protein